MVLVRFILVGLIIYLIIKSFFRYPGDGAGTTHGPESPEGDNFERKGVSKKIGEYIDYEEIDE